MEKFIPYEKLSKKKKRERNAERRGTWGISPVTRRPDNPKAYKRKKAQDWEKDPGSVPFLFCPVPKLLRRGRKLKELNKDLQAQMIVLKYIS